MTVQKKIFLLLALMTLAFVGALTAFRAMEERKFKQIADARAAERDRSFDEFLAERGDTLKVLVEDSTNWDDLVLAILKNDVSWPERQISHETLATYKVNAVWVYRPDWSLFYSLNNRYAENLRELPLQPEQVRQLFAKDRVCHFFVQVSQGWLEVRGGTVHPSRDRFGETQPAGYLLAGHFWIDENVRQSAQFTDHEIRIIPAAEAGETPPQSAEEEGRITFYKPLNGWDGEPVALIEVINDSPIIRALNESSRVLQRYLIIFAALFLVVMSYLLVRWVRRPLRTISRSLETDDPAPLQSLAQRKHEFGRLAGLILRSRETEQTLQRTEEQLRHAQKLEAVGRLAGGIAHDFNNLLTAIIGYSELLEHRLDDDDVAQDQARQIREAGQRAAGLTRQLLAFSRKQLLQPRVLDLNDLIREMRKLLERVIGEHIRIVLELDASETRVRADPTQLEQVMLNLGVNARDAMPRGGSLMLSTRVVHLGAAELRDGELAPGDYVMLQVSDTGSGMTEEVKARIFEPFFTTKGPGEGTGLGLATVYGIVKQSCGAIRVESEPQKGSIFTIFLPRADAPLDLPAPQPVDSAPASSATILVVEDDEIVRQLVCSVLEDGGYTVLCASCGAEAMRLSDEHTGAIDLLVTDVVMPEIHGPELARTLVENRPTLKVLFISGYSENDISDQGVIAPEIDVLQKPFTQQSLIRGVRAVLGGAHVTANGADRSALQTV